MASTTALPSPATDLPTIEATEAALTLPSFTADTAWDLGTRLRTRLLALAPSSAVVISISLANSAQLLFHSVTRPGGVTPDNEVWVARKRATVLRWGRSTWWMRRKYLEDGEFLRRTGLGEQRGYEYAIHGGGFPIRVKGVEGVVGVVVVSGLRQEEDHQVIVEVLKEYLGQ
ncbi:hypothetical protein EV356DRAFT_453859 [Viridothelium virens]|uniref:DUF967 domain protein n=1 Tax=Viridothelium virens TaxID=1048519 RepID=A0A6A6GXY9_VIRVR|nr:hypothetical protein EV356DRAFT_453859 [Viridothelium virens]